MKRRTFLIGAGLAGTAAVFACSSNDLRRASNDTTKVSSLTRADTLEALRPPKRRRPLVAILADNNGSETTDLIVPWSVLKRSDAADVVIVSIQTGHLNLMPALKIQPDMTVDQFEAQHGAGADYVIVPAFHNPKNRIAGRWLQKQSNQGATVAGICSGALVMAHAGLLADRRATTHWFDRKKLIRISPKTELLLNNRYLADRGVATSTGVSASLPFALTLVEAIRGRAHADLTAAQIGARPYGQDHDSDGFRLKTQNVVQLASNFVSGHEQFGVQIDGNMDELELAFAADAWSRTYRSSVSTFALGDASEVASSAGLRIVPDMAFQGGSSLQQLPAYSGLPANALDFTLDQISFRYGKNTANLVALQLEYEWKG